MTLNSACHQEIEKQSIELEEKNSSAHVETNNLDQNDYVSKFFQKCELIHPHELDKLTEHLGEIITLTKALSDMQVHQSAIELLKERLYPLEFYYKELTSKKFIKSPTDSLVEPAEQQKKNTESLVSLLTSLNKELQTMSDRGKETNLRANLNTIEGNSKDNTPEFNGKIKNIRIAIACIDTIIKGTKNGVQSKSKAYRPLSNDIGTNPYTFYGKTNQEFRVSKR